MNKEIVPYEEALELKELGFSQDFTNDGIWYYVTLSSGKIQSFCWTSGEDEPPKMFNPIIRPSFSQAFRWFREKHNLHSNVKCINTTYNNHFRFEIESNSETLYCRNLFDTHEEAELACLRKLIEIVKEKQNEQQ